MKRSRVRLEDVASWETLMTAYGLAARGKRGRRDVVAFQETLDAEIARLQSDLVSGAYRPAPMRCFSIRDPKPRMIHAPTFRDRIVHHAMMIHMGLPLDQGLIHDSYACRMGRGTHAAIRRASHLSRRAKWYIHADVAQYFASVDHGVLKAQLRRKFSDHGLLRLIDCVIDAHGHDKGLPIGALTSQVFANSYLGPVDRLVSQNRQVAGYVRYMDDMVWWAADEAACTEILWSVERALQDLRLALKARPFAKRTDDGMTFCGTRILPGRIYLSRRARRLFRDNILRAGGARETGHLDALGLQRQADSILATVSHCDSAAWRQRQFRGPLAQVLIDA